LVVLKNIRKQLFDIQGGIMFPDMGRDILRVIFPGPAGVSG
jgi:hypothetical protein